jgi:hypothetical protein
MPNSLDNFKNPAKRSPKSKADFRDSITPADPPADGFNTLTVESAIARGPQGIRNARKIALRYARKFQQENVSRFSEVTPWISAKRDSSDGHSRALARWAKVWRPRFLAALALSNSVMFAARHARVSRPTVYSQRDEDEDFARQWDQAQEDAIELLHARVWQRSIEGDVEPVWYMGVPVAYIRRFDSKLQIELLRAYRPDRFKTPGTQVNIGTRGDIFVLTEEQRHELQRINREWLLSAPLPPPLEEVGAPPALLPPSDPPV